MARIAGVDLPRNKRIEIALTYIYGLGTSRARTSSCKKAGISPDKQTDDLDENDVRAIRDVDRERATRSKAICAATSR